jgi:hypothetical protein
MFNHQATHEIQKQARCGILNDDISFFVLAKARKEGTHAHYTPSLLYIPHSHGSSHHSTFHIQASASFIPNF